MEIQKVIERTNQLLTEARYTNSRLYTYNWLWKKGILSYMNAKSLVDFDQKVGKECMLSFHDGGTVTFYHRDLIKSIDVLVNVFLNDNLAEKIIANKKDVSEIVKAVIEYLKKDENDIRTPDKGEQGGISIESERDLSISIN